VQEFQNLFLNNLSHRIIKSTLWLRARIYRDAMGAKSRANSTCFGESVFAAGCIQKTIKVDPNVRINRAYP
jgi:hypothetical protein